MLGLSNNFQKSGANPKLARLISEFDKFTRSDVIGHYTAFEVIEVLGFENEGSPFNVYTIAIATCAVDQGDAEFLCDRIAVPGLKNLKFGIRRSVVAIDSLRRALELFQNSLDWKPVDKTNRVGSMSPLERRFVPANSINTITLNRIIKNNYFNGSYILELFDTQKQHLKPLFSEPKALASLSEAVGGVVPIDLASVSDRLGNIILQFPIDVIRAEFRLNRPVYNVEVAWHPKSLPRRLVAIGSVYHDQTPIAFGCAELTSGTADLCQETDFGLLRGYVWDIDNKLLLAATDDLAFMRRISVNMRPTMHEPRVFPTSPDSDAQQVRVQLSGSSTISNVGDLETDSITEPIQSRMYDEERQNLARQRTFVQYGARGKTAVDDRKRALDDIRALISQHGDHGVWLWDPYLSPQDILDTLYWNKNAGSQMRALTLLEQAKECESAQGKSKDELQQAFGRQLSALDSNHLGLNIEFKSAHGPKGWKFHDRFLIFPASTTNRAMAWSLGTSVNSLGNTHHILQQVDNAQLVASAFEELWNAVSTSANTIWKHP